MKSIISVVTILIFNAAFAAPKAPAPEHLKVSIYTLENGQKKSKSTIMVQDGMSAGLVRSDKKSFTKQEITPTLTGDDTAKVDLQICTLNGAVDMNNVSAADCKNGVVSSIAVLAKLNETAVVETKTADGKSIEHYMMVEKVGAAPEPITDEEAQDIIESETL